MEEGKYVGGEFEGSSLKSQAAIFFMPISDEPTPNRATDFSDFDKLSRADYTD